MGRPDKKLHILNSDCPISKVAGTVKVNCGIELRNALLAFAWDETIVGSMVSVWPLGTCSVCANISDKQESGRHFVYALKNGSPEIGL